MNPKQWQKIKSLFDAAQELEPENARNFSIMPAARMRNCAAKSKNCSLLLKTRKAFWNSPPPAKRRACLKTKKLSSPHHTTGDLQNGKFVAGTILANRYRIIGLLGKGGMGEVYKAEDIKLNQTVALKFLPENFEKDKAALERFHAEVRTARQVSHPNVCRVFDIGEIDGRAFSLDGIYRRRRFVVAAAAHRAACRRIKPSRLRVNSVSDCAAIHEAGILHRDFKPANVIIDKRGKARITDFGIAGLENELNERRDSRRHARLHVARTNHGQRSYRKKAIFIRSGLLLYEIFTGKQAFQADSIDEFDQQTPDRPRRPILRKFSKDIDPLVEKVILQMSGKKSARASRDSLASGNDAAGRKSSGSGNRGGRNAFIRKWSPPRRKKARSSPPSLWLVWRRSSRFSPLSFSFRAKSNITNGFRSKNRPKFWRNAPIRFSKNSATRTRRSIPITVSTRNPIFSITPRQRPIARTVVKECAADSPP